MLVSDINDLRAQLTNVQAEVEQVVLHENSSKESSRATPQVSSRRPSKDYPKRDSNRSNSKDAAPGRQDLSPDAQELNGKEWPDVAVLGQEFTASAKAKAAETKDQAYIPGQTTEP